MRRSAPMSDSRWLSSAATGGALTSIWVAVLLTSVFAPAMVHGSEQQSLPIAALVNWFWGLIASAFVLVPALTRRQAPDHPLWPVLAGTVVVAWVAVTLISIFTPRLVTGSDPTQIPLAAMIAPVVGAFVTACAAICATLLLPNGRES